MEQEKRLVCCDETLEIEAYCLEGIVQKFPNHFHEYYVIGYMERGKRRLSCRGREYEVTAGDMVLLNPLDNHTCEQIDRVAMDWRCLNIREEVMGRLVTEITGRDILPRFSRTVVRHAEAASLLRELHRMIMEQQPGFDREEQFYFLIRDLLSYCDHDMNEAPEVSGPIRRACDFMEQHYAALIALEDLSRVSGLKKYTLLRHFTRQCGVTPYQYLETVRIGRAKALLEQGVAPMDAAMQTGFSDQSHFTRFFRNIIGLTPGQYQKIFTARTGRDSNE